MADTKLTHAKDLSDAFGYMRHAELYAIAALACTLPENPKVVNIGAGTGTSGLAFMESRGDLQLYTVEINEESPTGGLQNERNAFKKANLLGQKRHHQILGDSRKVKWEHGPVDMVFIDGDKQYDLDVDVWLPRIKEGGIVAFHDYCGKMWPQLESLIDRIMDGRERILRVDTVVAYRV